MWSKHWIEFYNRISQMPVTKSRTSDSLMINSYGKDSCLDWLHILVLGSENSCEHLLSP